MPPQIWRAGAAVKRVESLEDFYRDHASAEVAFVLDKYLPPSIQDRLKEMLKELRLLGPASQESQSEESGSETSSQPEEATLDHEDITEPAPRHCCLVEDKGGFSKRSWIVLPVEGGTDYYNVFRVPLGFELDGISGHPAGKKTYDSSAMLSFVRMDPW
ncbi:hypothetical protein FRC00_000859 [Tulasnella sp. 408]|nr:hypothetical protein FRC00_000859 [Tulasnella sp. 408]